MKRNEKESRKRKIQKIYVFYLPETKRKKNVAFIEKREAGIWKNDEKHIQKEKKFFKPQKISFSKCCTVQNK